MRGVHGEGLRTGRDNSTMIKLSITFESKNGEPWSTLWRGNVVVEWRRGRELEVGRSGTHDAVRCLLQVTPLYDIAWRVCVGAWCGASGS